MYRRYFSSICHGSRSSSLVSIFSPKPSLPAFQPHSSYSWLNQKYDASPWRSSIGAIFSNYLYKGVSTHTDPTKHVCGDLESAEAENSSVTISAKSSLKTSSRHDLAMIFTCKVCETRSVKTASRESYEKGVVVARCEGCDNLHLIADNLGWFGEPGSVEDFLAARGEEVKKGSVDTLNLTLEDLAGRKP